MVKEMNRETTILVMAVLFSLVCIVFVSIQLDTFQAEQMVEELRINESILVIDADHSYFQNMLIENLNISSPTKYFVYLSHSTFRDNRLSANNYTRIVLDNSSLYRNIIHSDKILIECKGTSYVIDNVFEGDLVFDGYNCEEGSTYLFNQMSGEIKMFFMGNVYIYGNSFKQPDGRWVSMVKT